MIKIMVKEKTDKTPSHPELVGKEIITLQLESMVILEGGMQSGATSVTFMLIGPDGKHYHVETSSVLFQNMNAALCGAEIRFHNKKVKNN